MCEPGVRCPKIPDTQPRTYPGFYLNPNCLLRESINQKPVPQATVADGKARFAQLVHHNLYDARACEDHVSAFRLQADNGASLFERLGTIRLDLPFHFTSLDDRTLNDIGIVLRHLIGRIALRSRACTNCRLAAGGRWATI